MTRNKVASEARRQFRQRRDPRREAAHRPEDLETTDDRASPSEEVAAQELLREFRRRLSAEERQLSELRADGVAWAEVAARLGGTAEGRRRQLTRAVKRVAQELGLDEADDA
jgi:hypothetical protein